jgi:hypothetical protein
MTNNKDVDRNILLFLNCNDLDNVRKTNKYFNTLCTDDVLWQLKMTGFIFPIGLKNKGYILYKNLLHNNITIINWAMLNNISNIVIFPYLIKNIINNNGNCCSQECKKR